MARLRRRLAVTLPGSRATERTLGAGLGGSAGQQSEPLIDPEVFVLHMAFAVVLLHQTSARTPETLA